jgi:hypothetical protein
MPDSAGSAPADPYKNFAWNLKRVHHRSASHCELGDTGRVGSDEGLARSEAVSMNFEIIGEITAVETIAVGSKIREVTRLRRLYGTGRWRKLKGIARIRLSNGRIRLAELHWYEAHGIGKREIKRKRYLD